jgi:hypothetical protein
MPYTKSPYPDPASASGVGFVVSGCGASWNIVDGVSLSSHTSWQFGAARILSSFSRNRSAMASRFASSGYARYRMQNQKSFQAPEQSRQSPWRYDCRNLPRTDEQPMATSNCVMHDMVSGKGTKERSMRARMSAAGRERRCVGRRAGEGSSEGGGGSIGEGEEAGVSAGPLAGVDLEFQKPMVAMRR